MTTAKALEHRIVRGLVAREREQGVGPAPSVRRADLLIAVTAFTAGLFVLGTYLEELLWAVMAALTVFALGTRE